MTEKKKPGRGRPRKHPGQPDAGGRTGITLNTRIDPDLRKLVPVYIAHYLREQQVKLDITQVVEKGLRELFQRAGLLPPDGAEPKTA